MDLNNQKELLAVSLRDQKGRSKRLFFASPVKTTRAMLEEILSQTNQLATEGLSLERLCEVAEIIADKYQSRRVAH